MSREREEEGFNDSQMGVMVYLNWKITQAKPHAVTTQIVRIWVEAFEVGS